MKVSKTAFKLKNEFGLAVRIIISLAIIAVIIWKYKELQSIDVRALIESCGSLPQRLSVVLGVYLIKGFTFVVPASIVYIAVGMAMTPWLAVAVNTVGIIIEISVTYLLGLILGGPYVLGKLEKTKYGKKVSSIYEKYQKAGIFIIRVAFLPIDLCSLFFGAMRTKYVRFLLLSLAGIMPRVILFTLLGDKVYDLIPMKYIVPAASAAIIAALIVWVVRYSLRAVKKEENFGKPVYIPICESQRNVILDTDMGPDCDDAGALAILFEYLKKYNVKLLGVANCTSNIYANGAIRAICEYYGFNEPYVGQHKGNPVLPDGLKYNKAVTGKYCRYESSACAADSEIEFYKKILTDAEDDSVTVITIGTFTNIAAILDEDAVLFNKKVHSIVSMAGEFPSGDEFNVTSDPLAAVTVNEKFKKMIVFSGHEVGKSIKTGFESEVGNNPVCDAYRLYVGGKAPWLRSSWDLTAVQYAFEGNGDFYGLSKPMSVTINSKGNFKAEKDKYGKRYFMIKKASDEDIAAYLNNILKGEN